MFASFRNWLYSRTLPFPTNNQNNGDAEADVQRDERRQQHLVDLWICGDRRGVPGLQDIALTTLDLSFDMRRYFTTSLISIVKSETPSKLKLREYLAHVTASLGLIQVFDRDDVQHPEFLVAVCKQVSRLYSLHRSLAPTNKLQHLQCIKGYLLQ